MENKNETNLTEPKKESLARDLARGLRFTGGRFSVITAAGVVSLAAGLIGVLYFDSLLLQSMCGLYALVGVVLLLQAREIGKCHDEEFPK